MGAVRGLPRAAPLARDPGLRRALQAERQPDPGAHPALPRAGGLQRLRRGCRHGHDRAGGGDPGHARRRAADRPDRPRPRAVDLRLSPDGVEPRLRRRGSGGRQPPAHVRGAGLRAGLERPGTGGVRRAAHAAHPEAVLRDAVRAAVQPLHPAAHPVRARGGRDGGQPGLARLLRPDRGLRGAGDADAGPLRAVAGAGRRVRGAGAVVGAAAREEGSCRPRRSRVS